MSVTPRSKRRRPGRGHGSSYPTFVYRDLNVSGGEPVTATFSVTDTVQRTPRERRVCAPAFERVALAPGESKRVTVMADPRLPARLDGKAERWRTAGGTYRIVLDRAAGAPVLTAEAQMPSRVFGR